MELKAYAEQLAARGLQTTIVSTVAEAKTAIADMIPPGSKVGIAGSVSIEHSGVYEELVRKDCRVYWHSISKTAEEGEACRRNALQADFYLCSANAVTKDGRIVNIDGKGNRIAAIAYGPKTVIFLVGKNKLVAGGLDEAFAHIKNEVCPKNAARLNLNLPCRRNGYCVDCSSSQRMCNLNLIIDRVPRGRKYVVFLVDQVLGH